MLFRSKSTFLQIVTYSGHNPFVLPDNLKRIHFKGDYPEKMRDYMTMANYTDHGLGILLNYLKSRPDYKDMMIVIIGDHEGLAADRKPICASSAAKSIVSDKQLTPFIVINAPVVRRLCCRLCSESLLTLLNSTNGQSHRCCWAKSYRKHTPHSRLLRG